MAESRELGDLDDAAAGHEDGAEPAQSRRWTDDARIFEHRLKKAVEFMDPYMDASHQKLSAVYRGAGGAKGRKALIKLVEKQISLLGTLKHTLERIEAEGEGPHGAEQGGVAVAR